MLYEVYIDIEHVNKSHCTCPYSQKNTIVCKHQVALYFSFFPQEAKDKKVILSKKNQSIDLPLEVRSDYNKMINLISSESKALDYAADSLRRDKTFILEAVKENYHAFRFVPEQFK